MKKAKIAHTNVKDEEKNLNESYSIKDLIKIIVIIVIVFVIFYFITTLVVKPVKNDLKTTNTITELDYTKITLNQLLDRNDKDYYVLCIKENSYNSLISKINYVEIYNRYLSDYRAKENSLPIYIVNLDDALNKNYIADELNISNNLEELKLNDEVLFKISDGVIEEYYIGNDDIIKLLSSLK